ncbi:hypothetical protein [Aquimarina sediminis]|uniref:hypothetical protein n=1 Tax=Aquimarina sediminis TaxID=2070536 RepID=UPI000CA03E6B|nr:hypothetical protein [Aquimarina sediminis]
MKTVYNYSFVLVFIWIGFVLAISFMEAPLKFRAPSVTTAIGVEIGIIVFNMLNKIEVVFSVFLLSHIRYVQKTDFKLFVGLLILFAIVGFQSIYLLPILDGYAELVINGNSSPSNTEHRMYVFLEVIKLFLLFYIGYKQVMFYRKELIKL